MNCFRVYRKLITWSSHACKKFPFCRWRPGYNLGNISSVTWRTLWILRRDVFELEQTISLEKNQDFSGSHICKGTLSIDRLLCAFSSKLYTLLNRVVFKILTILVTHWPWSVLELDFLKVLFFLVSYSILKEKLRLLSYNLVSLSLYNLHLSFEQICVRFLCQAGTESFTICSQENGIRRIVLNNPSKR